jgi:acyl-CoA synthetase (AMP-forming)/AMP-acid ligase II
MNIAGILHEQALAIGERPAIVERGRAITFAELDGVAACAAADLSEAGVVPGVRAVVLSPMSIALYTMLIALFRLRVTAVFVDPSSGRGRLNECIRRARPDAFIAVPRAHLLRVTSSAVRSIPIKVAIGGRVPGAHSIGQRIAQTIAPSVEPCDADTPAIITFTSGSTGEPKAAVRTHGFLVAQHRALVDSLTLEAGDVDLTTLPIVLLANLASGVTSVIPDADLRAPGAIAPAAVIDQIRTMRPTRTVASPAFLERLAGDALRRSDRLDTFRRVFTGGAPVFPRTLDMLATVAPAASIAAVYGSTEAEPIAAIDHRDITPADRTAMRQGAGLLAGLPVRSIRLRILPDRWGAPCGPWSVEAFDREALSDGGIGEIVVGGDHVLAGYLDGAGDEETKITVGDRVWHRTGDAGYLDRHGRLWLLGRCAERVSDEMGVLYPLAVECAASDVPGVGRSAFVGHGGRRVLVVERNQGGDSPREALMTRLAWAHLADVLIVPRIPVDPRHNAKVDYRALRRMLD